MLDNIRENQDECVLTQKIHYQFANVELLNQALTHKSFHNEYPQKSSGHNERLEFLGDAVLDLSLSDYLMKRFPAMSEGELSKIRASLVNETTLADLAIELGIDKNVRLGKGEIQSGGALKPRLLACAFEALVAAVFHDSNFEVADKVIHQIFFSRIENLDLENHFKSDYKTRLQELMQEKHKLIPIYELEREEGPDHDKKFFVRLLVNEKIMAVGSGKSKKQAEQDAARVALENI
jgi:ribonuclease-3